MTHTSPHGYPGPCSQRHTEGEATEDRRKATCLVVTYVDIEGVTEARPRLYCRDCCPVCQGGKDEKR
jgi:hypothetical protein